MAFTEEQKAALVGPLSRANVKKNPRGYDYVEAWHAIAEANRIFGHDGWSRETIRLERCNSDLVELRGKDGPYHQWRVGYIATVRVTAGGVIREGTGYGSGMAKPEALGDAMESAAKEAESDAMKRALMTFGNPFGLALYDKTQANVVAERPADRNGMGPSPEGPDWWGVEGPGMSAHQAKKDGLDVKHEDLRSELDRIASAAEWRSWCATNAPLIKTMPKSWRVILREEAQARAEELGVDFNSKKAA